MSHSPASGFVADLTMDHAMHYGAEQFLLGHMKSDI